MKTLLILSLILVGINSYSQSPNPEHRKLTLDTTWIDGEILTQIWDSSSSNIKTAPNKMLINNDGSQFHWKITEVFTIKRRLELISRKVILKKL